MPWAWNTEGVASVPCAIPPSAPGWISLSRLPRRRGAADDFLHRIAVATTDEEFPRGVPIFIDPIALRAVNLSTKSLVRSPVPTDYKSIPIKDLLKVGLDTLGLGYAVRDGRVLITAN